MARFEFNFDATPQGSWEFDLVEMLDPGLHPIVVTDEFGNRDEATLFVQHTLEPSIIEVATPGDSIIQEVETIVEVIPPLFIWASILLAILFLVFSGVSYMLARKISKKETKAEQQLAEQPSVAPVSEHKDIKRLSRLVMASSLIVFAFLFALLAYFAVTQRVAETLLPSQDRGVIDQVTGRAVAHAGTVRDPLTLLPVSGVTLASGDVTIETAASGQFSFEGVDTAVGVRLTHPSVQKTMVFLPDGSPRKDIFFNVDLYNTMIRVADAEAREDWEMMHGYLTPTAREQLQPRDLPRFFSNTYQPSDVADQTLTISNVERLTRTQSDRRQEVYRNVVRITTQNDGRMGEYEFVHDGANWQLIK